MMALGFRKAWSKVLWRRLKNKCGIIAQSSAFMHADLVLNELQESSLWGP